VAHQAQVPLDVISVTVPAHTGLGPEASARSVRQEALARAMEGTGATFLALGHTATDVAETFLQRLLEGAGRGQGPMPAVERGRLRPLVGVTRAQVRDAATALHLPFVDDQANEDPTVLRAFFRQELWPHLERRFGSPDLTLARACQAAQEDHDALERWATACQDGAGLGRGVLQGVPDAVAHRAVRHLVEAAAGMPVRTGGEAVRKAVQAARAAGGPVRRYKAGPVWLVVDRVDVRAEAGTPAPGAASAGAGAACYGPTANTDPGDGSRVSADAGKAG
jgi:tRNA(Ile)-lysidine synthase